MQNAVRDPLTFYRPKVRVITSDATGTYADDVELDDEVILLDTGLGAMTLTLPPVAQMGGRTLTIRQINNDTDVTTVAEHHAGDSLNWTDQTINAQYEGRVLYSDGCSWWILVSTS